MSATGTNIAGNKYENVTTSDHARAHLGNNVNSYVRTRLKKAEAIANLHEAFRHNHRNATRLLDDIAHKAEGVWLWTYLVTKQLCQELELGRDIERLQAYLDEVPHDLKAFFRKMIYERIDYRDHSAVAKLLKCAALLAETERARSCTTDCMSFLNFYCLYHRREADDPDFALAEGNREMSADDLRHALRQTRLYVGSLARDLLYVPPGLEAGSGWLILARSQVQFTHRTVLEYLLDPEMQSLLDQHIPTHFLQSDLIARITLARLKLYPRGSRSIPLDHEQHSRSQMDFYLQNAVMGISKESPVRTSPTDSLDDFGCLRSRNSHLSVELVAQYDAVAIRYLDTGPQDLFGRMAKYCIGRLLVSFGCTEYLESCGPWFDTAPGRECSRLKRHAVSALFCQPNAQPNTSAVDVLLHDEPVRALWEVAEQFLQPCPNWWNYLLYRWWMFKYRGKPRGLSLEEMKVLEVQIFAVAQGLCRQRFDIFQDPPWMITSCHAATAEFLPDTIILPTNDVDESLLAKLLRDSIKVRCLRLILWPDEKRHNGVESLLLTTIE